MHLVDNRPPLPGKIVELTLLGSLSFKTAPVRGIGEMCKTTVAKERQEAQVQAQKRKSGRKCQMYRGGALAFHFSKRHG